ncbi:MAG: chemotaxis protein CheW, partial [Gammaproteobacteria bacterium]|nr:chemotaxis protein CheW [Gammaproteobacteria bacterium]
LCLGAKGDNLVLDTARLVMPERYSPDMAGQYRQALKISDTNWYFAVDSIGSERSFNAQDVRWRSQHTRREWLAGTVIDQMCAIVDVESLHRSLLAASVLEASPQ